MNWDIFGFGGGPQNIAGGQGQFGSLSPNMWQDPNYRQNMMMNVGAGMLANSNQPPTQAFGNAWQGANQMGIANSELGLRYARHRGEEQDRNAKRQEQERRRTARRSWAEANPDNPMAQIILADMLDENDAGNAIIEGMKPPAQRQTSITDIGGKRVLLYDDTGEVARELGESPTRQQNAPPGYRLNDDGTMSAIEGGPATKLPAELAGKVAMMDTARKELPSAVDHFLKSGDGSTKEVFEYHTNSGKWGRSSRAVKVAIESALRAMTGAAAPESEVQSYLDKFMPTPYDAIETRQQKLGLLQDFMANADAAMQQGRTSEQPGTGGGGPIEEARDAIKRGANPDAVIQRLHQNGIQFDPAELGL